MYGRDNFRELFCSTWAPRDHSELVAREASPYTAGLMYPYRCDYCGLICQEKSSFCPECGRAMNGDAAEIIRRRLYWWENEILE